MKKPRRNRKASIKLAGKRAEEARASGLVAHSHKRAGVIDIAKLVVADEFSDPFVRGLAKGMRAPGFVFAPRMRYYRYLGRRGSVGSAWSTVGRYLRAAMTDFENGQKAADGSTIQASTAGTASERPATFQR